MPTLKITKLGFTTFDYLVDKDTSNVVGQEVFLFLFFSFVDH